MSGRSNLIRSSFQHCTSNATVFHWAFRVQHFFQEPLYSWKHEVWDDGAVPKKIEKDEKNGNDIQIWDQFHPYIINIYLNDLDSVYLNV
jgi:hypothetical protein